VPPLPAELAEVAVAVQLGADAKARTSALVAARASVHAGVAADRAREGAAAAAAAAGAIDEEGDEALLSGLHAALARGKAARAADSG
jgi:hypothetical protein